MGFLLAGPEVAGMSGCAGRSTWTGEGAKRNREKQYSSGMRLPFTFMLLSLGLTSTPAQAQEPSGFPLKVWGDLNSAGKAYCDALNKLGDPMKAATVFYDLGTPQALKKYETSFFGRSGPEINHTDALLKRLPLTGDETNDVYARPFVTDIIKLAKCEGYRVNGSRLVFRIAVPDMASIITQTVEKVAAGGKSEGLSLEEATRKAYIEARADLARDPLGAQRVTGSVPLVMQKVTGGWQVKEDTDPLLLALRAMPAMP